MALNKPSWLLYGLDYPHLLLRYLYEHTDWMCSEAICTTETTVYFDPDFVGWNPEQKLVA